ncbi:MAG TPA: SDR family NAD(P)-dependent oxidoreductase [Pyrinomonadaceae bacterium]|jgi:NAD(P)-dependent dehydrogenase (short-subunit alcohol dehydrogenase family)
MNDRKILDGQTALVTGADRGIGKGIALELARAGCRVAVNYYSDGDLAGRTVREITATGGEAFSVKADVSSSSEVEKMFDQVLKRFDQLHILVNNAGIQTWEPLLEVSEFDWDRVIDTNLKGTFLCTQYAAKHMKEYGGGAIVNVGSGCNKLAFPRLVAYTASKGGIEMFTKAAAVELGPYGIRVNCVAPGAIEVERTKLENPNYADTWGKITPLGRVGTPSDVGTAVVFLVSKEASFVSGQTIWVDGALFTQARWPYEELDKA